MTVNSMPIYWGNPVIDREFNRHSFINFYDFDNIDRMIDYVIELDNNDDMYIEKLKQHWFVDNTIPEKNQTINIKKFLNNIFI